MYKEIKKQLLEDPEMIVDILEDLDFNKIKLNNKEIRCSLPDGDNGTSVQIILNEFLSTNVYTRNEFQSEYQFNDFISLIQYVKDTNPYEASAYICRKLDIKVDGEISEAPAILKAIKKFKHKQRKYNNEFLPLEMYKKYQPYNVIDWNNEGISKETQEIFDIRIDEDRCRWLIPSYDENGNLLSVIGRTYLEQYKEYGLPKYIYYKFDRDNVSNMNLFGINIAREYVKQRKEIIIFEGAKSVMKAFEYGYKNSVAVNGCQITKPQIQKILSLHANIVIAFDKDRTFNDIRPILKQLSKYTNVSYILDNNLLEEKDSPVDKGKEVFDKLYERRKQFDKATF